MSWIRYLEPQQIPPGDRVDDNDHIIRVHGVHSRVMKLHYQLYAELMRGEGPLTFAQREMVATVVSALNQCHY
jgi:alkylhydroperoxidase family enzyme